MEYENYQLLLKKALEECEKCRKEGYSCAESVFRAMKDTFSLSVSSQLCKGITAFAGGAAGDGRCGALEAGLCIMTILYENEILDQSYTIAEYSNIMHKKFREQNGSILCSHIFYPLYDAYICDHADESDFECAFFSGLRANIESLIYHME